MDSLDDERNSFRQSLKRAQVALAELPTEAESALPTATATDPWPVLDEAALHGPPGQFVRLIEPYTEADSVAILLTLLTSLGAAIGPGPHVNVEHTPHHARLNALLIGATAGGRKGTSGSHPRLLLKQLDTDFVVSRIKEGLSSGEGLVYCVRDADGEDPGESDKRLLIVESEFASVLKVMERDGNVLSTRLRTAWDCGNFSPLTKRDRLSATGAHISILGHITREELLRALTATERVNGFANRFLFALVRRSKCIPSGKGAPNGILQQAFLPFLRTFNACTRRREIARDLECEQLWGSVYSSIEEELPGVAGAILARGAAQVLRLSLIYSLLDELEAHRTDPAIRVPHLLAALAVWDYCKASVFQIFGDAIGDPIADRLLREIKLGPQTDSDLYGLFGKHRGDGVKKEQALQLLIRLQRIHSVSIPTAGRPTHEWHFGPAHTCRNCALRVKR
jgi:hypothetical protein